MAVGRRTLWVGTTISLIAFLPTCLLALEMVAATGFSDGMALRKWSVVMTAALVPAACLIGPVMAWRTFDRGRARTAALALLTPMVALTLFGLAFFAAR